MKPNLFQLDKSVRVRGCTKYTFSGWIPGATSVFWSSGLWLCHTLNHQNFLSMWLNTSTQETVCLGSPRCFPSELQELTWAHLLSVWPHWRNMISILPFYSFSLNWNFQLLTWESSKKRFCAPESHSHLQELGCLAIWIASKGMQQRIAHFRNNSSS